MDQDNAIVEIDSSHVVIRIRQILYTTVMRAKEVRGNYVITSIYPSQRLCSLFKCL